MTVFLDKSFLFITERAQAVDSADLSCGPQFSALYPEMVDALILLDSYGFLPTKPVFLHVSPQSPAGP